MCKYCEEINGKINGENIMETSITYTNFDKDYSSALCIEVLDEDHTKKYITIGDFRNTINFCPMCGRKLNKD